MDDLQQRQSHLTATSRASDILSAAADAEEEKPVRCAKFRQQELWAWKPVWSPMVVVIMYTIVAVIFIPIGAVIFVQSTNMVSTPRLRYDNMGSCGIGPGVQAAGESPASGTCSIRLDIDKNITGPSYFYYGLVNFYQNARTYVESRSFSQLRGDSPSRSKLDDSCEPRVASENDTVLNPCGLVAGSFFNDSFELCEDFECQSKVELNGSEISWKIDRDTRFQSSPDRTPEENALVTSEDFMVWMRASTYRNWKKLYRRIDGDLQAGTYWVSITSNFPVESFDGEKFFFISETRWFGGPNRILGGAYMTIGSITLILALAFLVRSRITPDLDLPPETSVPLDGISPDPIHTSTQELADDGRPIGVVNA